MVINVLCDLLWHLVLFYTKQNDLIAAFCTDMDIDIGYVISQLWISSHAFSTSCSRRSVGQLQPQHCHQYYSKLWQVGTASGGDLFKVSLGSRH